MWCLVFIFSLLTVSLCAEEERIEATLYFQIWRPSSDSGILIESDPSKKAHGALEHFYLRQGEFFSEITCSEVRRSKALKYKGNRVFELYRSKEDKAESVARVELSSSGAYSIILLEDRGSFQAFTLALDKLESIKGSIQFVNTTMQPVSVAQVGKRAIIVRSKRSMLMQLDDKAQSTAHLLVKVLRNGGWRAEFSRIYNIQKNSRSVGFFYEKAESKRLQVKFFSGF